MNSLGYAVWAAKVGKTRVEAPLIKKGVEIEKYNEKCNQVAVLQLKNEELTKHLHDVLSELSTYKKWDDSRIRFLPLLEILEIVCAYFKCSRIDLMADRRYPQIVLPRHAFFYLARRHTLKSYNEIANKCGGRDHTTVMHGSKRMEDLRRTDPQIQGYLDNLEALMHERLQEMRNSVIKPMSLCPPGALALAPSGVGAPKQV